MSKNRMSDVKTERDQEVVCDDRVCYLVEPVRECCCECDCCC